MLALYRKNEAKINKPKAKNELKRKATIDMNNELLAKNGKAPMRGRKETGELYTDREDSPLKKNGGKNKPAGPPSNSSYVEAKPFP